MTSKKKPAIKDLSRKSVEPRESGNVKGGKGERRLAANHNQTLR